jgi:hypothetical protein
MMAVERHVREVAREPAESKECHRLKGQTKQQHEAFAQAGPHMFRAENTREEAAGRDKMRDDLSPIAADGGDAEEDDVARHGVGEDMTVIEKDDCIQQAAGRGEK